MDGPRPKGGPGKKTAGILLNIPSFGKHRTKTLHLQCPLSLEKI
jgi:hypothetical protein